MNNLNSEKRRANHMYSDINGRELGVLDEGARGKKATHGNDFTSTSDWRSAQSELLRRNTAEYSGPVAKNASGAMS